LDIKLSNNELRVIGCLLEKESTTPDQYPLSLNALTNACNQKSNRYPVMSLDESTAQETLDALSKKHLVVEKSLFGGRTAKYQHRFCNTEFSDLQFSAQEHGILCVLFLRGAQTPGELRTRTNRLCEFNDVNEVEDVLERLASPQVGPFVKNCHDNRVKGNHDIFICLAKLNLQMSTCKKKNLVVPILMIRHLQWTMCNALSS
jgi:uncharacterized protein YceH (UPF0502 family)